MTESDLNYIINEDSTFDKYSINDINIINPLKIFVLIEEIVILL